MSKSTKDKIVENAIYLFNDKGYYSVSLRDIADKTGIAIGNLTYYFNKKEDLISYIITNLQEEYLFNDFHELSVKQLIEFTLNLIEKAEHNRVNNSFYYENLNQFATEYESLNIQINIFINNLFINYYSLFQTLKDNHIFHINLSEEELESFTISFINSLIFWDHKLSLKNNKVITNYSLSKLLINTILSITNDDKKHLFNNSLKRKS